MKLLPKLEVVLAEQFTPDRRERIKLLSFIWKKIAIGIFILDLAFYAFYSTSHFSTVIAHKDDLYIYFIDGMILAALLEIFSKYKSDDGYMTEYRTLSLIRAFKTGLIFFILSGLYQFIYGQPIHSPTSQWLAMVFVGLYYANFVTLVGKLHFFSEIENYER